MQTQVVNKELTGFKAEISGVKITDTEDVIRDTIINSIRDLDLTEVSKGELEAKFEIKLESEECDFLVTGRRYDSNGFGVWKDVTSLYDFNITAIKDQPVYFSINDQTQYDFIDSIVEEVDKW